MSSSPGGMTFDIGARTESLVREMDDTIRRLQKHAAQIDRIKATVKVDADVSRFETAVRDVERTIARLQGQQLSALRLAGGGGGGVGAGSAGGGRGLAATLGTTTPGV